MNNKERAEKLIEALLTFCIDSDGGLDDLPCAIGYIFAYQDEAVREAINLYKATHPGVASHAVSYASGFTAAREKASFMTHKWAGDVFNGNGDLELVKWIREHAERIRAMEPGK